MEEAKRQYLHVFFSCIAAGVSVLCMRSGFLSFFFLFPLALVSFLGEAKASWGTGILTVALNIILSVWFYLYGGLDPLFLQWSVFFISVMVISFTWINNPLIWGIEAEVPYRLAGGGAFCALCLAPLFLLILQMPELRQLVSDQLEAMSDLQNSELSDVQTILAATTYVCLRGGLLVFCIAILWANRQLGLFAVKLIRRFRRSGDMVPAGNMSSFLVKPFFIWILSFALGIVILARMQNIEILEIAGWNVLVFCATLYLIQGGSVGFYLLAKLPSLARIITLAGFILLLLRPGINIVVLCLLVLLGILENWVPFRVSKTKEP